jgi:hypothetical protein
VVDWRNLDLGSYHIEVPPQELKSVSAQIFSDSLANLK